MPITRSTNLDPSIQFIISHAPYQSGQILEQDELLNHKNCQPNISVSIDNYFNNQSPQANLTNLYVSEDTAQKYSVKAARDMGKVIAQWIRYYGFVNGKGEIVRADRALACNIQIQNFASDTLPVGQTKKIWKNSSDRITFDGRTFDSIFFDSALTNLRKTGAQILDTENDNTVLSLSDYIKAVAESIKRSCDENNNKISYPRSIHWNNIVEYAFDDMLGDVKSIQYVGDNTKSWQQLTSAGFIGATTQAGLENVNTFLSYAVGTSFRLFAGGVFNTAGGITSPLIAAYNGTAWAAVAAGFTTNAANSVNSFCIWNHNNRDYLMIGGNFNSTATFAGVTNNPVNLARYDLTVNNPIATLPVSGLSNNVGVGLSTNATDKVNALAIYNNKLYVGGFFTVASGTNANNIVEVTYNSGTNNYSYSALGTGARNNNDQTTARINCMVVYKNNLIVGGLFNNINGVSCNNIAQYNGSSWSALQNGVNEEVFCLSIARDNTDYESGDGKLYVGGKFTTANNIASNKIASWNGNTWTAINNGPANDDIRAIINPNRSVQIVVGGTFTNFNGSSYIARYNPTSGSWSTMQSPPNGSVFSLANVNNFFLVAGGKFTTLTNSVSVNRVARFQSDYLSYFDIMRTNNSNTLYQEYNTSNNTWENKTLSDAFSAASSPTNVTANLIGNSSNYRDPKNAYQSANRNFQIAFSPFLQKIRSYAMYKVVFEPFRSVFPFIESSNYNHLSPISSQFITRLPADPNNVFLRIPNTSFTNVIASRSKPHLRADYQSCVCFSPNFTKYTTGTYISSPTPSYTGNFWPADGIAASESSAVATDDSTVQLFYDKQSLGTTSEEIYRNWAAERVKACAAKNNIIPIIPWIEAPYEDAANLTNNGRLATSDDILFILKEHYKVGVRKWFVYCPKLQSDNQGTVVSYGKSRSDLLLQVIKDFMSWTNTQTKHSKGIIGAVN